ncbi:MAG: DUF4097 domain-containing protein, partial [Bacilli bacterium]|nr:DUF4097 domain-containing protein [Bacilli bacterium]
FAALLIVSIFSFVLMALGVVATFGDGNSGENFQKTYQDVVLIDVDVAYANIIVQAGDEFSVEASNVSKKFSSTLTNGKLKIKEKKNWLWGSHSSGKIVISVPRSVQLSELKVDSSAGKIEIDEIIANRLDVSQGAGLLTIRKSEFFHTDIDGGAGMIEVSSSKLRNLDLDSGVGKVSIEATITGNSKIDCGVGAIELLLFGTKDDYKIEAEKGLGSIKIDGHEYKSDSVYGEGSNTITLDGGVGSINIRFNDSRIDS